MTVDICGPKTPAPSGARVINTTSRSKGWSQGLSPFLCGPVELYGGYVSKNMENAWQYSKVYPIKGMLNEDGSPSDFYFRWAQRGWWTQRANRYPLGKGEDGKGKIPSYSYWDGQHLSYIQARIRIYCPLYAKAVQNTMAWIILQKLYSDGAPLWLWDFDGYDHKAEGLGYEDILLDESRSLGHSFVLAMLLEEQRVWEHIEWEKL